MERESERAYLGTLMLRKPGAGSATVKVEPEHFSALLRGKMLTGLRALYPWTDSQEMERELCATLSRQFGLKAVQLEVGWCLGNSEPWGEVDHVAQRVLDGWKRRSRVRLLDEARTKAHDSEAIAEVCSKLLAL